MCAEKTRTESRFGTASVYALPPLSLSLREDRRVGLLPVPWQLQPQQPETLAQPSLTGWRAGAG
jgi:hypothetical protein